MLIFFSDPNLSCLSLPNPNIKLKPINQNEGVQEIRRRRRKRKGGGGTLEQQEMGEGGNLGKNAEDIKRQSK